MGHIIPLFQMMEMFSRTEAKYVVEATNAANKMMKLGRIWTHDLSAIPYCVPKLIKQGLSAPLAFPLLLFLSLAHFHWKEDNYG